MAWPTQQLLSLNQAKAWENLQTLLCISSTQLATQQEGYTTIIPIWVPYENIQRAELWLKTENVLKTTGMVDTARQWQQGSQLRV